MLPKNQPSAPILNVIPGQNATHTPAVGPKYYQFLYFLTVTKTAATSGFTSAAVSDVVGMIEAFVNNNSKRQHLASELDAIQTAWKANLAIAQYDGYDNNFNVVADVTGTINGVASSTSRTTTFVLIMNFAEPMRDNFISRAAGGWPTSWLNARGTSVRGVTYPANFTAQIQVKLAVANNSTIPGATTIAQYTSGSTVFSSWAMRAEEVCENITGPLDANGQPMMPITHWFRQSESYTNTTPNLRSWAFDGNIQQHSFLVTNSSDAIATYEVKGDGDVKSKGSKQSNDRLKVNYEWNSAAITPVWFHLAFDNSDNPADFMPFNNFSVYEINLNLLAATATSKQIIIISQVYRDGLA